MSRDDDNIDASKLEEYVLGLMDESARKVFEQKLSGSEVDQRELLMLQQSLGFLAEAEPLMAPSAQLRERVLGSLGAQTRFDGYVERFVELFDLNTTRAHELLGSIDRLSSEVWESSGIRGASVSYFAGGPRVEAAICGLMHMEAGHVFPAHVHTGNEWVFILQGYAYDDSGRLYQPGDIVHSAPGTSHAFRVADNESLVFGVVLEKPNKWLYVRSVLDRLLTQWRFKNN